MLLCVLEQRVDNSSAGPLKLGAQLGTIGPMFFFIFIGPIDIRPEMLTNKMQETSYNLISLQEQRISYETNSV